MAQIIYLNGTTTDLRQQGGIIAQSLINLKSLAIQMKNNLETIETDWTSQYPKAKETYCEPLRKLAETLKDGSNFTSNMELFHGRIINYASAIDRINSEALKSQD